MANKKAVLLPYPIDKAYDYIVPAGVSGQVGSYVSAPLGQRQVPAVVWGEGNDDVKSSKLKEIVNEYHLPALPADHRKFLDWMAHYTMAPKGSVLKLTLSVASALEPPKPVMGYQINERKTTTQGLSPKAQKVLDVARDGYVRRASELSELAGCSASVVKGLADKDFLRIKEILSDAPCKYPDANHGKIELSDAQQVAADDLAAMVKKENFDTALLDGVTGSGKTEVYFEAVALALKQDKQVLILLPEIALSNAFIDRFKARFGCLPALWHSSLSPAKRKMTWRGVAKGESKVIIGARSALFLPYQDLGLIIIDEEHDPAYKQEEGVIYNARDMAIVRAKIGDFPIALVSATPSLETIYNAWSTDKGGQGRYKHLVLPDRHGGAVLPDINLVDLRTDKPESRQYFISPTLHTAMVETLERDEQVLLFLNRRGYAPLTLCRNCGHRFECPRCSAWLIEHRGGGHRSGKLHCHHCDHYMTLPKQCPECNEEDSLAACGPGVERILEEVQEAYPEARIAVLSSDTATSHDELKKLLSQIHDHEVDIIIGTQIVAKGHHFPKLTCVGVIDADLGLSGGDLRASERTYQLLHQVSGRAGREQAKGQVFLQTFSPENRVMQALAIGDRDMFLRVELSEREGAFMAPFSRVVGVIVSGRDERQVADVSRALGQSSPNTKDDKGRMIQTLGPAEAPFYRLRGKYRRRLLIRADKTIDVQKSINHWLGTLKIPSAVRVQIDIDPQSFF